MANIKFSQFTVGNTESDIDFVVGYKGANNIQISPTNLLAASLSGYLPLTGGTMTAGSSVLFLDNSFLRFGTSADATIYHDATNTYFKNFTGDLILQNNKDDKDIIFQSDDGSGGTTEYFRLDGGDTNMVASKTILYLDTVKASFGNSEDLKILHNGTFSSIQNNTGDLKIINYADDEDIVFESDNGSGGTAEYFRLDGSLADGTNVFTKFVDNSWITMGNGGDLLIGHQTTSSKIENYTGPLYIVNKADDQDIIFQSDNGSGGTETYFYLDGSAVLTYFPKPIKMADGQRVWVGDSGDAFFYHDTNTFLENATGRDFEDLYQRLILSIKAYSSNFLSLVPKKLSLYIFLKPNR